VKLAANRYIDRETPRRPAPSLPSEALPFGVNGRIFATFLGMHSCKPGMHTSASTASTRPRTLVETPRTAAA